MPDSSTTESPTIKIDGAEISEQVYDELAELRVSASNGSAAYASLRFNDAATVGDTFAVGKKLEVMASGSDANEASIFIGEIASIGLDFAAGRSALSIGAYDAAHRLGQQMEFTSHLNMTPGDVIEKIASDAKLTPKIDASLGTTLEHIQQSASPLDFISQLAHVYGCEWRVEGEKTLVVERRRSGTPIKLTGGDNLRSFSVRFTAAEQASSVEVRGWDPKTMQSASSTVTPSGATTLHTGVSAIDKSRKHYSKKRAAVAWPTSSSNQSEMDAIAAGVNARMEAATVSGRGEVSVDARLRPGIQVEIGDVVPEWNGIYYLSGVEHVFGNRQPFVTRFSIGGNSPTTLVDLFGPRTASRANSAERLSHGVTVGEVTNITDPDDLGRVKVRLPYLSDEHETDWARVVQLGAGAKRGFQMQPEVGDEVLVTFENGDLQRPYVLGGLWNGKSKPLNANAVTDGQVIERSITTRTGHTLVFSEGDSDDKDSVMIRLGDESATLLLSKEKIELKADTVPIEVSTKDAKMTLDNGKITLKSKDIVLDASNGIELKGGTFTAKTDTSAEVKAGTDLKLSGGTTSELSGSATTTIKGGMVKIN